MGVSEFQNSTVAELSLNIIGVENNSFSTQLASIVRLRMNKGGRKELYKIGISADFTMRAEESWLKI